MNTLLKIDPQWFLFDIFLFAFIAWVGGTLLFKMAQSKERYVAMPFEKISTEGFGLTEWIGSLVVIILYSTNVWLPLLIDLDTLQTETGGETSPALMIIGIFVQFIMPSIILLIILGFKVNLLDVLGLRNINWGKASALGLAGFFISLLSLLLLSASGYEKLLFHIFGDLPKQAAVQELMKASSPIDMIIIVTTAVVIAPIFEEILFRSFLYTSTKRYTGPIFSIIASSLLFSVIHGSVSAFFPLFIIGAILAIAYELSGSLWTNIFIHAAFNLFNVLMMQAAAS